ncbi:MAG: NYN domain-containing protein [Anaerolineae bacterium]|nr:NYN domain-containing protein [Anaerolineae bacterium]
MQLVPNTLTHERVAVFVDYHNTLHALRRVGRQIDLLALHDYLSEGRHLVEAMLYIATHPQPERQEEDRVTLHRLRQSGFLVRSKVGQLLPNGRLKCDFDLEMALDIQEFIVHSRPDIVVLVTGDGDFTPLVQRLRLRGVRVEIASTPGSVSAALRAMANGFIDLTRIGNQVDHLPLADAAPEPDDEPLVEVDPAQEEEALADLPA